MKTEFDLFYNLIMHVPDGFINAQVSIVSGIGSFATLWAYVRNAKNLVAYKLIALTGMMAALIFVLQMINFPIAAGTSGHLLGGALAVIVLGPHLGIICISIVVVIQSFLKNISYLCAIYLSFIFFPIYHCRRIINF